MGETVSRQPGATARSDSDASDCRPWGLWTTAGLGALVLATFILIHGLVSSAFAVALVARQPTMAPEAIAGYLENNGQLWAIATCATGVLCTSLILLLARLRRTIGVREYLGLRVLPWRSLLIWLGIGIVVIGAIDAVMLLAGQEIVSEFWIGAYRTAAPLPLFWIALVFAAPVFEEFLFRGFLFSGWLNTRLGEAGTILLTSVLWTLIHAEYEIVQLLVLFAYGIVLGLARCRTGSLIAPLVIHGTINLVAAVQLALLVSPNGGDLVSKLTWQVWLFG